MNHVEGTADIAVGTPQEAQELAETPIRKMGRPLLFETPEVLEKAITKAINNLRNRNEPLIVENIALELDCSPSTLRKYRERSDYRDDFLPPIKKLLDACLAWQASQLYRYNGQVAGAIFALKNNFPDEYRDKTEQDLAITGNVNVGTINYADLPAPE